MAPTVKMLGDMYAMSVWGRVHFFCLLTSQKAVEMCCQKSWGVQQRHHTMLGTWGFPPGVLGFINKRIKNKRKQAQEQFINQSLKGKPQGRQAVGLREKENEGKPGSHSHRRDRSFRKTKTRSHQLAILKIWLDSCQRLKEKDRGKIKEQLRPSESGLRKSGLMVVHRDRIKKQEFWEGK